MFVHGLGGDAEATWGAFPTYLEASDGFSEEYDIVSFSYETGQFGSVPSLTSVAIELQQYLDNNFQERDTINFLTHSQGGLIARRYVSNILLSSGELKTTKILTFATPHLGSALATAAKRGGSAQVKDNATDSDFIMLLGQDWHRTNAHERVQLKYVSASKDRIVSRTSSTAGNWSDQHSVISGTGHIGIVKPDSIESDAVRISVSFFLEPTNATSRFSRPNFEQPSLVIRAVSNKERNRFFFGAEVIPLLSRDLELEVLTDFLEPKGSTFSWMLVTGSGGVGKSRLAHELCKIASTEWYSGFIDSRDLDRDWRSWQPLVPTLIVVDYAGRMSRSGEDNALLQMITDLSDRTAGQGLPIARPTKLLLLDREPSEHWANDLREDGYNNRDTQYQPLGRTKLNLGTITDPIELVEWVLTDNEVSLPERRILEKRLSDFDAQRRPLFAHLLAETIIGEPDKWLSLGTSEAITKSIDRERKKFWKPAGASLFEERVLAAATITRGMEIESAVTLARLFDNDWVNEKHPGIFEVMTGQSAREHVSPLEPDILGEYFVLEISKGLNRQQLGAFSSYVWETAPVEAADFFERVFSDVDPTRFQVHLLDLPKSESVPFPWLATALRSINYLKDEVDSKLVVENHIRHAIRRTNFATATSLVFGKLARCDQDGNFTSAAREHLFNNLKPLLEEHLMERDIAIVAFALKGVNRHFSDEDLNKLFSDLDSLSPVLVECCLRSRIGGLVSFLETCWRLGQKSLAGEIYKQLYHRSTEITGLTQIKSLGEISSYLKILSGHEQYHLAIKVFQSLEKDLAGLFEGVFNSPLAEVAAFLQVVSDHGQIEILDELYEKLDNEVQRIVDKAFRSSLGDTGTFLKVVHSHGQNGLLDKLYVGLGADVQRLFELSFNDALDDTAVFLRSAFKHGQEVFLSSFVELQKSNVEVIAEHAVQTPPNKLVHFLETLQTLEFGDLVDVILDHFTSYVDQLTALSLESNPILLGKFFKFLIDNGKVDLTIAILEGLSVRSESYTKRLENSFAGPLLSFLHSIPTDRVDISIRLFSFSNAAHWSPVERHDDRHWQGASNLASFFRSIDRTDLAQAIVDGLFHRKKPRDFGPPNYRILEFARFAALIQPGEKESLALTELFEELGAEKWIRNGLPRTSDHTLSTALSKFGACPNRTIVNRMSRDSALVGKTRAAVDSLTSSSADSLGLAVRLVGGASLCGISFPRSFFSKLPSSSLSVLPSTVLPHRDGCSSVEGWQYSLWLGLRSIASITGELIPIESPVIELTTELWSANFDATSHSPDLPIHRLNASMVAWLTECMKEGGLIPDRTRLSVIAGYKH